MACRAPRPTCPSPGVYSYDHIGAVDPGGFGVEAVVERVRWLEEAAGDRNDRIERSTLVQMTHVGGDAEGFAPVVAALAGR